MTYYDQKSYKMAEPLFEQAIQIIEKTLGAEHPTLATYLNNFASLKWDQGLRDEAKLLYEKALVIGKKSLGTAHPTVKDIQKNIRRTRVHSFFDCFFKKIER